MTKFEKLALEMTASLMEFVAALAKDSGAKSELMSLHLPNLSPEQRKELQEHLQIQLKSSQQLKEHVKTLKVILDKNQ